MKIKKILFLVIFIILLIGLFYSCKADLSISLPVEKTLIERLAEENNIDISDYPYYFSTKRDAIITTYYSQVRIKVNVVGTRCDNYGSTSTFKVVINQATGSINSEIIDMDTEPEWNWKEEYTYSNHNLYYGDVIIFNRNVGYEYDVTQENEEIYSDIMQVKNNIKVYDGAAINYDEILALEKGDIVKRIKRGVNQVYGHSWDKVMLSDGTEGYVFAEELEMAEEYTELEFEYNSRKYDIFFNPIKYGIENIEEYPYYIVGKDGENIIICYSKERIRVTAKNDRRDNYGSSVA